MQRKICLTILINNSSLYIDIIKWFNKPYFINDVKKVL